MSPACPRCAAALAAYREMSRAVADADLDTPRRRRCAGASRPRCRNRAGANRRDVLNGFAIGSALSAIAASGLVVVVLRSDDEQRILSEVVSAHLRSLQAGHLTDVHLHRPAHGEAVVQRQARRRAAR